MEHRQRRPCSRIRCSRIRCSRIGASASNPAPERGADHHSPRYAPGRTRRSRSHRQRRQKARAAAHHAPQPWPFSFAHLPALPPARPAGSAARHALGVAPPRGKAGKYPGSAGRSTRILRPPPAPGRISTASAAPDDHASSRPPHQMTTHQRQRRHLHSAHSLPALPDLTAAAQPPAPPPRKDEPRQRRHLPPPALLPPAG